MGSEVNQVTESVTSVEQDAQSFLYKTEDYLSKLNHFVARTRWVHGNFITYDTSALVAEAEGQRRAAVVRLAHEASQFNNIPLSQDTLRKLDKLKLSLTLPTPIDEDKNQQLSKVTTALGDLYGQGKYCRDNDSCLSLTEINRIMSSSQDYEELLDLWTGWHDIAKPMKPLYEQEVLLANQGARELGYNDTGAMWRSKYDMPPEEFTRELEQLWLQVKPFYQSLHCHVRAKLSKWYGDDKVALDKPIPAHLLGNMWAQSWINVYPIVAPESSHRFDLTELLKKEGYDELKMVRAAENFFTSIGFSPLPDTFYERSLFTKPRDRDVHCHASAWSLDGQDDIRIKMCIQKTGKGFHVIHHELGHNFYHRAYREQPFLYQQGANDGFHEAIGDTITLSVTPGYLHEIGLLEALPAESEDIGFLMKMALDKVAFLPFGLLVDQWRWKVFSGEITSDNYNQAWWSLREEYQGVRAPVHRNEGDFDPGAKYHVPKNTPYVRYFLAHIMQFEFHRTLCEKAGSRVALHRCSIYKSKEAGRHFNNMLEMGASRPWQEIYADFTGKEVFDASAMLEYFAPLQAYLDEQNQGLSCGW